MGKSLRIAGICTALFLSYNSVKAQVKIGGDPSSVNANAILELESPRKGLLLPRLDKAGFDILVGRNPDAGMVIYLRDPLGDSRGAGFYVKTGTTAANASWTKMGSDDGGTGPWKINGNAGLTVGDWFGTQDAVPLIFKVNNTNTVMQFNATNGNVTIPYANVPVAAAAVSDVLMIGSDGLIQKKDLALTSVTSLNTFQGDVTVKITASGTAEIAEVDNVTASKEIDLQLPVMEGGATQQYGFMKIEDWRKLQAITSVDGITIGTAVAGVAADIGFGARIVRLTGANAGKLVLHLVEASATQVGIVNIGAQTFAGEKTFASNLTLGADLGFTTPRAFSTATPLTYNLAVLNPNNGNKLETVTVPAASMGGIAAIRLPGATPAADQLIKADNSNGSVTLLTGKTGNNVNIEGSVATNSLTIHIPDASVTATGLVTTEAQTFNGIKTIDDTLNIGGSTVQTSRMNVNGSMSLPFKVVAPGDYTLDGNDHIVVVKCNASGTGLDDGPITTVTLPTATTVKNRVYTIRRAPRIANEIAQLHIKGDTGLIDGKAEIIIYEPNFAITVISDGTTWHVISRSVM